MKCCMKKLASNIQMEWIADVNLKRACRKNDEIRMRVGRRHVRTHGRRRSIEKPANVNAEMIDNDTVKTTDSVPHQALHKQLNGTNHGNESCKRQARVKSIVAADASVENDMTVVAGAIVQDSLKTEEMSTGHAEDDCEPNSHAGEALGVLIVLRKALPVAQQCESSEVIAHNDNEALTSKTNEKKSCGNHGTRAAMDVTDEIRKIKNEFHSVTFEWIQGHQDMTTHDENPDACLNNKCDALANEERQRRTNRTRIDALKLNATVNDGERFLMVNLRQELNSRNRRNASSKH